MLMQNFGGDKQGALWYVMVFLEWSIVTFLYLLFLQLLVIMSETARVPRMEFAKQQTFVSVIQDILVIDTLFLLCYSI